MTKLGRFFIRGFSISYYVCSAFVAIFIAAAVVDLMFGLGWGFGIADPLIGSGIAFGGFLMHSFGRRVFRPPDI